MSEEKKHDSSAPVWLEESLDPTETPAPSAEAALVKEKAETGESGAEEASEEKTDKIDRIIGKLEAGPIAPGKTAVLRSILIGVRESIDNALGLLEAAGPGSDPDTSPNTLVQPVPTKREAEKEAENDNRVVEGVFNGAGMVGDDGKEYSVPPNYASKSKLVEGDMLKLQIGDKGNFVYKQIGPIDRQRLIGVLAYEQDSGQYTVMAAGRSWKVLKASVTYFKAEVADEAIILVPKNAPSKWAAVENVIKRNPAKELVDRR